MFYRNLRRISLALAIFTVALVAYIVDTDSADVSRYYRLVASSRPPIEEVEAPTTANQVRYGVEKVAWFPDDAGHLQLRITSDRSEVNLSHFQNHLAATETLHHVRCFMQEGLYFQLADGREAVRKASGKLLIRGEDPSDPTSWITDDTEGLIPMQRVRYLEADRGTHDYSTNTFIADHAIIYTFSAPGHTLVDSVEDGETMMKGLSRSIEFALGGKEVNFRAHDLKMTFYTEKAAL